MARAATKAQRIQVVHDDDADRACEITAYIHCARCLDEWKSDPEIRSTTTPKDYARTQAGFTATGLQVWCNRHECNVDHMEWRLVGSDR